MGAEGVAASWLATRLAMTASAEGLGRRRARLWRRLRPTLAATPALAPFAGKRLDDLPITEVADLRADYGRWNSLGLTHDALHAAAADAEAGGSGEVRPGVVAGYSTGSRHARGLFVADARERADYIGQVIARVLPLAALLRPIRIALLLRANSRLYSDSRGAGRRFLYLPLTTPAREAAEALNAFSPTVLIAPSSRLLALAQTERLALPHPTQLFYGAEPMSEAEAAWLADRIGVAPAPLYQATEGFLGAACQRGALHLNDHSLEIELEPVPGVDGFCPVITDLRRTNQPIVRVRGDDLIELDPRPCDCGYAGRRIRPVMGRAGDVWRFGNVAVTPRQLSEAMDRLVPPPHAWQAIAMTDRVELRLSPSFRPDDIAPRLAADLRLPVSVVLSQSPPDPPAPKRHRMVAAHG